MSLAQVGSSSTQKVARTPKMFRLNKSETAEDGLGSRADELSQRRYGGNVLEARQM
jgi:hypothetical protein